MLKTHLLSQEIILRDDFFPGHTSPNACITFLPAEVTGRCAAAAWIGAEQNPTPSSPPPRPTDHPTRGQGSRWPHCVLPASQVLHCSSEETANRASREALRDERRLAYDCKLSNWRPPRLTGSQNGRHQIKREQDTLNVRDERERRNRADRIAKSQACVEWCD